MGKKDAKLGEHKHLKNRRVNLWRPRNQGAQEKLLGKPKCLMAEGGRRLDVGKNWDKRKRRHPAEGRINHLLGKGKKSFSSSQSLHIQKRGSRGEKRQNNCRRAKSHGRGKPLEKFFGGPKEEGARGGDPAGGKGGRGHKIKLPKWRTARGTSMKTF